MRKISSVISDWNQKLNGETQFRVRRSPAVKEQFFLAVNKFLAQRGYTGRADGDFKDTTNLIFGDEKTAEILFTAHYDTSKTGYTAPNFYVTNKPGFWADGVIVIGILLVVLSGTIGFGLWHWWAGLAWFALMVLYTAVSFTFDNKFNFNDNTSGDIALLEIADRVSRELPQLKDKLAFVFTDREEDGLKGGKKLNAQLSDALTPEELAKKLVLNIDCVGGRDTIFRLYTHSDAGLEIAQEIRALSDREDFKIYKTHTFPSDSSPFKKTIPAISLISVSKGKFPVKDLERLTGIHSKHDTLFDEAMVQEWTDLVVAYLAKRGA
ncbi:MAG: M28 family peptidase [Oscillospiraceae bacterium]|jgi:hypothetical protein|nr:M28 family peptidase [Oscillospiraceae bacterium]